MRAKTPVLVKRTIRVLGVISAVAIVGACGVNVDVSVREINRGAVPEQLLATSTTTTTTTSTTTTTTSIAPPSTDAVSTTTTVPALTTKTVSLFFLLNDRFVEEFREVPLSAQPRDLGTELARGPLDPNNAVLASTAVNFGDIEDVVVSRGVATVVLAPRVSGLQFKAKILLAGQIVLTMTSLYRVGQVRFELEGEPFEMPQGDATYADGALAWGSFSDLIETQPVVIPTSFELDTAPTSIGSDQ
jgi:hypothetical protein